MSQKGFAGRVRELVAGDAMLVAIIDPLLAARDPAPSSRSGDGSLR